jgi:hypothetical protein
MTSNSQHQELYLKELALDHLGIPRPGAGRHLEHLQDQLLPSFMETVRYAGPGASKLGGRHETAG